MTHQAVYTATEEKIQLHIETRMNDQLYDEIKETTTESEIITENGTSAETSKKKVSAFIKYNYLIHTNPKVHHTNCTFQEYFCSPTADDLIDKKEDDVVTTAEDCSQRCIDDKDCEFFTFFKFRRTPACFALKSCKERVNLILAKMKMTRRLLFRNQLALCPVPVFLDGGVAKTKLLVHNWI
jgi:hypothetical protein